MAEKGTCRSCKATVLWVRNVNGNLQILDAEPSPTGNVIIKDGVAHTLRGDLFEQMADGPRYVDHHATCATAALWRKKKEAAKAKEKK